MESISATDPVTQTTNNLRRTDGQQHRTHDEPPAKPKGPSGSELPTRARKNFIKQIKIASWNVRTLSDATTSKRQAPKGRSALVSAEFIERLDVDLACLSEC